MGSWTSINFICIISLNTNMHHISTLWRSVFISSSKRQRQLFRLFLNVNKTTHPALELVQWCDDEVVIMRAAGLEQYLHTSQHRTKDKIIYLYIKKSADVKKWFTKENTLFPNQLFKACGTQANQNRKSVYTLKKKGRCRPALCTCKQNNVYITRAYMWVKIVKEIPKKIYTFTQRRSHVIVILK